MKKSKKPKKRINLLGASVLFFLFACICLVFCNLWVNNRRVALTIEIQSMKEEIAQLKGQNAQLDNEISYLKSPDRVFEIAAAAGLSRPN